MRIILLCKVCCYCWVNLQLYTTLGTIKYIVAYESWLKKQGKSENTIGIRFRNIRMIFNLAMNMELAKPENYPFKKFKVSKLRQDTAKRALTKEEILSVMNYNTVKNPNGNATFFVVKDLRVTQKESFLFEN